jgi:hypothetical protein
MSVDAWAVRLNAARQAIRSTRPGFSEMMQAHEAAQLNAAAQQPPAPIPIATPHALIAPEFDAAYYLENNEDVRLSGMDPLEHFMLHGAAELRNPNAWFETGFYVRGNADVVDADVNPFWHYLAHGKAERRQPAPQRRAERLTLAQAVPASARWIGAPPDDAPRLDPEALRSIIGARLPGTAGLTVSVSHDRYTESVGGVQILVADEQAAFNRRNETYLHIAPAVARPTLAPPGAEPFLLHLTIDGAYIGLADHDHLTQAVAELAAAMPAVRRLIIHCLLGHRIEPLIALHVALGRPAAVFWVNDYEAVCVGYNLLRNDVSFCGGPPPGSLACRICVYGEDRDSHLAQLGLLFAAIPFHVVAPSQAALAVWRDAARLPHASIQVHEYARIRHSAVRSSLMGATQRGTPDNPVRIAFAGYAMPHKGWPAFVQLAAAISGMEAYQAFHLTALAADPPLTGVTTVMTKVTADARGAMTDALIAHSIDLVLVLSAWPETFCLVAYEAIAAGADVIALPGSGNVADMVLASGRGLVMPDTGAIIDFFTSGAAVDYVRMCGEQGSEMGRVESRGMTATLPLPEAPDLATEAAPSVAAEAAPRIGLSELAL